MQCTNHLKQIGLAFLNCEGANGAFPSGGWGWRWAGEPERGTGKDQPGSWEFIVLSFMEQQELRDMGNGLEGDPRRNAIVSRVATPVPTFNCPSRRSAVPYPDLHAARYATRGIYNLHFPNSAKSDYGACSTGSSVITEWGFGPGTLADGDDPSYWTLDHSAMTGVCFQRSEITFGDISDGTSNTLAVGEKYLNPDHYTTGQDDGDNESMYAGFVNDNHRAVPDMPAFAPRPDTPGFDGSSLFGSAHSSAFNAVLCDGSVQSISYEIEVSVLSRLGNRQDGLAIPEDAF
jgi:hypothetical protein